MGKGWMSEEMKKSPHGNNNQPIGTKETHARHKSEQNRTEAKRTHTEQPPFSCTLFNRSKDASPCCYFLVDAILPSSISSQTKNSIIVISRSSESCKRPMVITNAVDLRSRHLYLLEY